MSIQHVLTSLRFTTTQWVEVVRCAFHDQHSIQGSVLNLDLLEARVLYSASPLPVEIVVANEAATTAALDGDATLVEQSDLSDTTSQAKRNELVCVDTATKDYQLLVDAIVGQDSPERELDIVFLQTDRDSIRRLTRFSEASMN